MDCIVHGAAKCRTRVSDFTFSLSSHGIWDPHPPHQATCSGFAAGKGKEDGPTANALGNFAGHVTVPEKYRTLRGRRPNQTPVM